MQRPGPAFGVRETHGILWRPENVVRARSDGLGWTSLYASAQRETPYEQAFAGVRDHLMILHLDGPVGVSRLLGGGAQQRRIEAGGLFILPGGVDFGVRLEGGLDSLHVYVRDSVLREVAADYTRGDPARLELLPRLGDRDPMLEQLALGVRDSMGGRDPTSAVYADYLARAVAARLLRAHAARAAVRSPDAGRLTTRQLARAIACMEANLTDSLSLDTIAESVGLSPSHFARRFKASVGHPPHRHLTRLRVARAERLLAETAEPIAAVAAACGFSHQEHLTRLFAREVGTTPAVYRRVRRG